MQPVRRSTFIAAGAHEIHLSEWGDPSQPALIMWHGLARTGRDFDELASALCHRWYIICPDTLGRGLSSWALDHTRDYAYQSYGDHALAILDYAKIDRVAWLGTSMGGLLGMTLAAERLQNRITHLVVNDVGPTVPQDAIRRIAAYAGAPPEFATMAELESWFRTNYKPFGVNSSNFWSRMRDTSARRKDNGKITVHYDPQIVSQFTYHPADLDCWSAWDKITAKTLLLRGKHSDVLPLSLAQEMCQRGPKPQLQQLAQVGHAPTLTSTHEIRLLAEFIGS